MRLTLLALALVTIACGKSGTSTAADAAKSGLDGAPAAKAGDAAVAAVVDAAPRPADSGTPDARPVDAASPAADSGAAAVADAGGGAAVVAADAGGGGAAAAVDAGGGGTAAAPAPDAAAGRAGSFGEPAAAIDAGGATAAAPPPDAGKAVAAAPGPDAAGAAVPPVAGPKEIVFDEPLGVGDVDVWPLLDAIEKAKPQLDSCRPKGDSAERVRVQFHVGLTKIGLAAPAPDNKGDASVARCIANRVKAAAPKWPEGVSGILFVEVTVPPK